MTNRDLFNFGMITLATSLALNVLFVRDRTEKILLFIIAVLVYILALIMPDTFQ